jgi:hypothetical protein
MRDGGLKPPRELAQLPERCRFAGRWFTFHRRMQDTMVLPHVGMPQLYPVDKFESYKMPEAQGSSHWHDWVDAVIAGQEDHRWF